MQNVAQISLWNESIVDSFNGGGGASTGIEMATGKPVDIAINHDLDAILMHRANHPYSNAVRGVSRPLRIYHNGRLRRMPVERPTPEMLVLPAESEFERLF